MSTIVIAVARLKFPLGEVVVTANAQSALDPADVQQGLSRHARGDWGDVPPEDVELNETGLKHGERLFSAYGKGETLRSGSSRRGTARSPPCCCREITEPAGPSAAGAADRKAAQPSTNRAGRDARPQPERNPFMTNTEHTPGPWRQDWQFIVAPDPDGVHPDIYIAEISEEDGDDRIASPEQQASQRAADRRRPDLLAACRDGSRPLGTRRPRRSGESLPGRRRIGNCR